MMSVIQFLKTLFGLANQMPPEVRGLVVEMVKDIVAGDPKEEAAVKAARAARLMLAKKTYRRDPA